MLCMCNLRRSLVPKAIQLPLKTIAMCGPLYDNCNVLKFCMCLQIQLLIKATRRECSDLSKKSGDEVKGNQHNAASGAEAQEAWSKSLERGGETRSEQ